jgi:hypothetical protein
MTEAMMDKLRPMGLKKALEAMARGAALVNMHTPGERAETGFYVVPGGRVDPDIVRSILVRPDVRSDPDGLFPGHAQTWRMIDARR